LGFGAPVDLHVCAALPVAVAGTWMERVKLVLFLAMITRNRHKCIQPLSRDAAAESVSSCMKWTSCCSGHLYKAFQHTFETWNMRLDTRMNLLPHYMFFEEYTQKIKNCKTMI
jgi:hypothetical protein